MVARLSLLLFCCFVLAACETVPTGRTRGVTLYDPKPSSTQEGIASWYNDRKTASGERLNPHALTAAHRKLPFGTKVRVIDLKTGKSIIVRINDRGPYKKGRIIDLTTGAARQLGTYDRGIAKVRIEVLREIPLLQKPNLHYTPKKKPTTTSTSTRKAR